jgi:excisionase family DNA binding protein
MSEKCRTKTVAEVAKILGISKNSAYDAVHSGAIPSIRLGKRFVVPIDALNKMLEQGD